MFCCVHQGNLYITPVPSKLTKYAQKTLYTKTPLSRGLIGKTFPDTEKNNEKTTKSNTDLDWVCLRQPSKNKFLKHPSFSFVNRSLRGHCTSGITNTLWVWLKKILTSSYPSCFPVYIGYPKTTGTSKEYFKILSHVSSFCIHFRSNLLPIWPGCSKHG